MRQLSEDEMQTEARAVGRSLPPGAVVFLEGEVGSGKTTFIKAIAHGLGATQPATSPTYALVHRYHGRRGPIFHVDCYRLETPDEARDVDWEGLLAEGDVILIEWPERAGAWLPAPTLHFRLHHLDDLERRGLERVPCG